MNIRQSVRWNVSEGLWEEKIKKWEKKVTMGDSGCWKSTGNLVKILSGPLPHCQSNNLFVSLSQRKNWGIFCVLLLTLEQVQSSSRHGQAAATIVGHCRLCNPADEASHQHWALLVNYLEVVHASKEKLAPLFAFTILRHTKKLEAFSSSQFDTFPCMFLSIVQFVVSFKRPTIFPVHESHERIEIFNAKFKTFFSPRN